MFFQNLLCCGSCSGQTPGFLDGQIIAADPMVVNNKIVHKQGPMRAQIRMGEIMKLKREDKVPALEVIVEMENDQINPNA